MKLVLASFYRALLGAFHPRMLWLTLWPFLAATAAWGLGLWYGYEWLVNDLRVWLIHLPVVSETGAALSWLGLPALHLVILPAFVALVAVPLIALSALILCATIATPAVLRQLGRGRYASLARRRGGGWLESLLHALVATGVALLVLLITLPLWLMTPLFALLPPLIWGWLTYRIMSYDALAEHASREERRTLMRQHRWPLLTMGIAVGLIGTLPFAIFGLGTLVYVLFPVTAALAIWLYAYIFVFSALWFAHYCLPALTALRAGETAAPDAQRIQD